MSNKNKLHVRGSGMLAGMEEREGKREKQEEKGKNDNEVLSRLRGGPWRRKRSSM